MLKTTILSTSGLLGHTRKNINKLDKDSSSSINSSRIKDKLTNLLTIIKKISFEESFFTFEDSLAFIQLKKAFTKALILYYFDLKHHI